MFLCSLFPSASTTTRPPTPEREQNSNGQVLYTAGVAADTPATINRQQPPRESTIYCQPLRNAHVQWTTFVYSSSWGGAYDNIDFELQI